MLKLARILALAYLALAAVITIVTVVRGPLAAAPFPLPIGPSREPIVVQLLYSAEKYTWLEEAAGRFMAEQQRIGARPIVIELRGAASGDIVQQIVGGAAQPTAISPASSVQLSELRAAWQAQRGGAIVGDDAPALVRSPLVLVAWRERGAALWPGGTTNVWRDLQAAVADQQGWAGRNHPEWGTVVKFAHTPPDRSNSGLQTLVLLAYTFHNKDRDLQVADVRDPRFVQWLQALEAGAPRDVPASTGTLMTDMLRFGPSKYDVVAVYEHVAIEQAVAAQGRGGALQVYYPSQTLVSDHPFAVLDAPWVAPEQREAAEVFRAFLLQAPQQQLALQFGLRPGNERVAIDANDPANMFTRSANLGVQMTLPPTAQTPAPEVLDALVEAWRQATQPAR